MFTPDFELPPGSEVTPAGSEVARSGSLPIKKIPLCSVKFLSSVSSPEDNSPSSAN